MVQSKSKIKIKKNEVKGLSAYIEKRKKYRILSHIPSDRNAEAKLNQVY